MRMHTSKLSFVAVGAAALALGLAGCAGGQSVADACKTVNDGLSEEMPAINELMSTATSGDLDALGDQISEIQTKLDEIGDDVTNEEVSSAYKSFTSAFGDMATQIQALGDIDTTDTDAVNTAVADMQEATTAMTDAQTELTEVCSG